MKGTMLVTHYGSKIDPGDVFMHQGSFLRLVYADTAQITLRSNPFVTHPDQDTHYIQVPVSEAVESYGLRVILEQ